MSEAYIQGLLHDATIRRKTVRIAQNNQPFLLRIRGVLEELGCRSWLYQEGRTRMVYILEFSRSSLPRLNCHELVTRSEKIDYVRGYFDAEGGIAKSARVRFYIYFAQKDLGDLKEVRSFLVALGISCGQIHNPSRRIDPNYYRFYIATKHHRKFAQIIGSWHPEKAHILGMKI